MRIETIPLAESGRLLTEIKCIALILSRGQEVVCSLTICFLAGKIGYGTGSGFVQLTADRQPLIKAFGGQPLLEFQVGDVIGRETWILIDRQRVICSSEPAGKLALTLL